MILLVFATRIGFSQNIIDPCFLSLKELGFYYGSDYVQNVCDCTNRYLATDIMEWNGSEWLGRIEEEVNLPPPAGCSNRGIFLGYEFWTRNGEAVALKLDTGLVAGNTYSYTFTYATNGPGSFLYPFAPVIYTRSEPVYERTVFRTAVRVGQLPGAGSGWTTNTISFTATPAQQGHDWIVLHAIESSGILLSNCELEKLPTEFLGVDRLLCDQDSLEVTAVVNPNYKYSWTTGDTTSSITITAPGNYGVTIDYHQCSTQDEVTIEAEDCEPRLIMPNFFSPGIDDFNKKFIPKEINYIDSGSVRVFNRWGKELFQGDLITGWDGSHQYGEAGSGVYYYEALAVDRKGGRHYRRGTITLVR